MTCPFCNGAAHAKACPELRALLFVPDVLDRIFANVVERLAHPHPCASCGDMTCADICAACQEWESNIIASIVHDGLQVAA